MTTDLLFIRLRAGTVAALTLFAAGAASSLAQRVLLDGVSNPPDSARRPRPELLGVQHGPDVFDSVVRYVKSHH